MTRGLSLITLEAKSAREIMFCLGQTSFSVFGVLVIPVCYKRKFAEPKQTFYFIFNVVALAKMDWFD